MALGRPTHGRATGGTEHHPALGLRAERFEELGAMDRAHTHPDVELNWLAEGAITYLAGGRRWRVAAGQIGIFWGGIPHQSFFEGVSGRARDGMWLTLPLAWMVQCGLPGNAVSRLISGEVVVMPMPRERAEQWLADLAGGGDGAVSALLEIEAILRRWARGAVEAGVVDGEEEIERGADGTLAERVTRWLAANYREGCSMADLGANLRMHPNYVMTAFTRQTGRSVGRYLLDLRLAHAQQLLVATDESVLEIAFASGFGSAAAFYAAFRRELGEAPLRYRRCLRNG